MTWVTDGTGTRWVDVPRKKRRRSPRALRFAELKAGAVLIHRFKSRRVEHIKPQHPFPVANDDNSERLIVEEHATFVICEDRWFDPCAGQEDRLKGEMASVRAVQNSGLVHFKYPHTLRGLASQGYNYATPEQAEEVLRFVAEREELWQAHRAGKLTREEVAMRATSWREFLRRTGIDKP